jgi:recombination protein RecT
MAKETAVAVKEKTAAENVLAKVDLYKKTGRLVIPDNYSPENAINAAWMYLQEAVDKDKKPVLEVCSQLSIASALFNMVIDGLSVTKKQCYFIAYGNKLICQISYFGNLAKAKRMCDIKTVNGAVVYEGDKKNFKYEIDPSTGIMNVIQHTPSLDNIDNNKIVGAYAVVVFNDGNTKTEIMTIKQIKAAWMMGNANGNSPAHRNFPDQMAIRTVINRALKIELSSSDDSYLGNQGKQPELKAADETVETIDMEVEVIETKVEPTKEPIKKDPSKTATVKAKTETSEENNSGQQSLEKSGF